MPLITLAALLATLIVGHRLITDYASGVLDIYPVYWGAHAWLAAGDAYRLAVVQPHVAGPLRLLSDVGNVYPMPATLMFLPIALLPPKLASVAYLVVILAGLITLVVLTRSSALLLLFAPLVVGLVIEQLTVLVFLAQIAALLGVRTRRRWLTTTSLLVCALKPSQTLMFIALVLWEDRKNIRLHLALLVGVFSASLLAQPDWPVRWLSTALARNGFFPGAVHWLWWAAPMALLAWRWGDRVAAVSFAQFALVPTPLRLYTFTPLALDATAAKPMGILVLGQIVTGLVWSRSPELAVAAGIFIPRLLAAQHVGAARRNRPPPTLPSPRTALPARQRRPQWRPRPKAALTE